MGTLTDKLHYTADAVDAIQSAIETRIGRSLDGRPLADYPERIRLIDEWEPDPDWFNIKEIIDTYLAEHPEWKGGYISLIDNGQFTTRIKKLATCTVITSDGATYADALTEIDHTWNTSLDRPTSVPGSYTRWVMYLSPTYEMSAFYGVERILWSVWRFRFSGNPSGDISNTLCGRTILAVEANDDTFSNGTNFQNLFYAWRCLNKMPDRIVAPNAVSFSQICINCSSLLHAAQIEAPSTADYRAMFAYCYLLRSLSNLDCSGSPNPVDLNFPALTKAQIVLSANGSANISGSPQLSQDSLRYIIENMPVNESGETRSFTVCQAQDARLSDELKELLRMRNWTYTVTAI